MPVGQYTLAGGIWRGHNRADVNPSSVDTGFVDDVTRPVWLGTNNPSNNVGCFYNVPRTTVSSIVQAPGKIFENLTITSEVRITVPGQRFRNCRGTFSYTGDNGGGVFYLAPSTLNAPAARTVFEFCEIEPSDPHDRYNGIYGHDFYCYRTAITKTVDGFGLYNSSGADLNVEIACSWVGYLAWFDDDYGNGRPNGHSDGSGTHNDFAQNGGCRGSHIHGNFIQGAKYNALNPTNLLLDADGMEFSLQPGNGVTPLDNSVGTYGFPQQGNLFLGKADAYANVGDCHFHHNWLWNGDNGFKLQSNGSATKGQLITDINVHDNIFGGVWRNWGGSQRFYPIRYDNNCVVNGIRQPGGATIVDTSNNRWDPSANPGVLYGDGTPVAGSPVRHRVDAVTAF